jgi:hypothetical protein
MTQETIAFFKFAQESDIPYKVIETGEDAGVWFALAVALRKCDYRKPDDIDQAPLDASALKKMLVRGRIYAVLSLLDFALLYAPFCRVQVVQDFGVATVNGFTLEQYKSGQTIYCEEPTNVLDVVADIEQKESLITVANRERPGAGSLFSLPTTRLIGLGDGRTVFVTADVDFSDERAMTASFLKVHPEWSNDVILKDDGDVAYTLPCALALSKFLDRFGVGDPERSKTFQHQLTEQIIESAGSFEPKAAAQAAKAARRK